MDIACLICGIYFSAVIERSSGDLYFSGRVGSSDCRSFEKITDLKWEIPKPFYFDWKMVFRWLFLGKSDPTSPFHLLPVEIVFNLAQLYFQFREK